MPQSAGSTPTGNNGQIDMPGRGRSVRISGNFMAARATGRIPGSDLSETTNSNADGDLVRRAPSDGRLVAGNASASSRR